MPSGTQPSTPWPSTVASVVPRLPVPGSSGRSSPSPKAAVSRRRGVQPRRRARHRPRPACLGLPTFDVGLAKRTRFGGNPAGRFEITTSEVSGLLGGHRCSPCRPWRASPHRSTRHSPRDVIELPVERLELGDEGGGHGAIIAHGRSRICQWSNSLECCVQRRHR